MMVGRPDSSSALWSARSLLLLKSCQTAHSPVASADAPEHQLRALVRLWMAHVIDHRDHMLVFQQERHLIERGDAWRGVRASRKQFERLLADLLARVQDTNGGLPGDRRLALSALLGMVNHTPQWYRRNGRLAPQEVADGYVDLLLGLAAPSPS